MRLVGQGRSCQIPKLQMKVNIMCVVVVVVVVVVVDLKSPVFRQSDDSQWIQ